MVFKNYKGKPDNFRFSAYAKNIGVNISTLRDSLGSQTPLSPKIHKKFQAYMGDKRDYSKLTTDQLIRCLDERMVQLYYQKFFGENGVSDFQSNLWAEKQEGEEP